jgi:hypothetical protein
VRFLLFLAQYARAFPILFILLFLGPCARFLLFLGRQHARAYPFFLIFLGQYARADLVCLCLSWGLCLCSCLCLCLRLSLSLSFSLSPPPLSLLCTPGPGSAGTWRRRLHSDRRVSKRRRGGESDKRPGHTGSRGGTGTFFEARRYTVTAI